MDLVAHEPIKSAGSPSHPLDPLSADELRSVVAAARAGLSLDHRHMFVTVQLEEPPKNVLAAWRSGDALDRTARVAIWDCEARALAEHLISTSGEIRHSRDVPGAMAPVLLPQAAAAIEATLADPRIRDGLARRGVTAIDDVHVETWPFGGLVPDTYDAKRRMVWTPMWERKTPDDNQYAHPVHGLYAVVDLDTAEVVDVEDHGMRPIPEEPGHYRQSQLGAPRLLNDLQITQPEGPSFTVDGWRIQWQKWEFRIGFCPREGLVIHQVRYDDEGTQRAIAHRLSIAELVIPYGDPSPGSYRKNAFDTGEIGVGFFTNSLELGCDCLGEIRYLDVAVAEQDGTVRTIPNGVCLHEEDHGILWKHTDTDGHVEVRRSRRFVVSSIFTVDNYEYGYYWYFYQDGTIEFEGKLTGIVLTLAGEEGSPAPHATELAPGLLAPYHQHIFCARLDLDIDGDRNTVCEIDLTTPPTGPQNPYGGAFLAEETPLRCESEARRVIDPFRSRFWKITNPSRTNRLGHPVAYKLVPGHTTYPLALTESSIGRRAGFMYHHLWVTPYDEGERYPAGEYPFQHPGGDGLPAWIAGDRSTEDADVVVWHVFGTSHIPRAEDWPVMPVERTGFQLKPAGFFDRNPALDVPASARHCH